MRTVLPTLLLLAATLCAGPAGADAERGRILYEDRCYGCHSESIHGRDKRVATDLAAVRAWVRRWSANLGLAWTDEEVNDVVSHLNTRYYRFTCPPGDCRSLGGAGGIAGPIALDDRTR